MPPTLSSAYPAASRNFPPIKTPYGDLIVRSITSADGGLAQDFVTNLSPGSRYFRFFQVISRLSPDLMQRFLVSDGGQHLTLIALTHIDGRPRIVGEARYIASADGFAAEFAVAIADQWQRHGIARGLIARLEQCAAQSGIRHLSGETLPNNEPLIAFARTTGFRIWCDASNREVLRLAKCVVM